MKSTLRYLPLALFITVLALPLFAQAPTDTASHTQKIAVVDLLRVLNESEQGKSISDRLDSKQAEKQKQFRNLQLELMDLEDRLRNDRYGLSEAKKLELQKDYEQKLLVYRQQAGEAEKELGELRDIQYKGLEKDVAPILTEIGKDRNLDLILDKWQGGVIYSPKSLDITDEVIQLLNARTAAAAAPSTPE